MINQDLTKPLDLGGQKLYYQILPDICRHLDPRRIYWPSSPCGGEHPNSELQGNCHWWHPFFMNPDINRRIRHEVWDECRARFVTEYGAIGPCHLDSIREYLLPEEMHPGNKAWQLHTNLFEKETVPLTRRTLPAPNIYSTDRCSRLSFMDMLWKLYVSGKTTP
jgi:beta-mannosidase